MEIKIEGDPGTGNTFIEINIQYVESFHADKSTHAKHQSVDSCTKDSVDPEMIRTDILTLITILGSIMRYIIDKKHQDFVQL